MFIFLVQQFFRFVNNITMILIFARRSPGFREQFTDLTDITDSTDDAED